jgi:thiol-disulfide isomerase/thioredoxin
MDTNTLLLIGLIVVIALAVVYGMFYFNKKEGLTLPSKNELHQHDQPKGGGPPPAQQSRGANLPALVFFYADWCGHCKQFAPLWPQIKSQLQGKATCLEVNDKNPEISKFGIRGFPTIRLYPTGNVTPDSPFMDYKGPRSVEAVVAFVLAGGK